MSSASSTNPATTEQVLAISRLLGDQITSVETLSGGRNSRVFSIQYGDSERCVAKFYPDESTNLRSRQDAEFDGFTFLRNSGIESVPKPIAIDKESRCAIYEFVDGTPVATTSPSAEDISQVVGFLASLDQLCGSEGSTGLQTAADACFSVNDLLVDIDSRLQRLLAVNESTPQHSALSDFLANKLEPRLTIAKRTCEEGLRRQGLTFESILDRSQRTLSPSDFGFHNMLRLADGNLVFLDFEYFGWDDPAKMICDFLLHPAMELSDEVKQQFLSGILENFSRQPDLADRVKIVMPLCGLKWSLLLLNEFVPAHLQRRQFASERPLDVARLQMEQLNKSQLMLEKV